MLDERFRKVALVLKNWNRLVSRSKDKRLNSFSIYLLLLVYMLNEKYMINLQALAPHQESITTNVHTDNATLTSVTASI